MTQESTDTRSVPSGVDPAVPNRARLHDFLLGGEVNFDADRTAAEYVTMTMPGVRERLLAQRAFLRRAVHYLTSDCGIDQFLDIGPGIPAQGNTHEIAWSANPDARIAYVDNDATVVAHGSELLAQAPGRAIFVHGDLRDPGAILADRDVRDILDFNLPVAVLITGVLQFVNDDYQPFEKVAQLMAAMSAGSYLLVTHATQDRVVGRDAEHTLSNSPIEVAARTHQEILGFFAGLDLVEPGLVPLTDWRPAGEDTLGQEGPYSYGGVAVKS